MPIFDFQNGGRLPSWIFIFSHFLLKIQILLLFLHRLAKFDGDWTIRGRVSAYFLFSKWRPSAILDFIFLQFCEKFKLVPISTSLCKIWWKLDDQQSSYCIFSIFKMAAVRHLGFSYFRNFCEKFKFACIYIYIFVVMQNLVKIGWSVTKLLRIINFHTGGRPPTTCVWWS